MRRPDLVADCSACAAVCCVATSFDAGPDFAITKSAGAPCVHLRAHRCAIHDALEVSGFGGCAAYDCHGAGPRVTRMHDDAQVRGEAFHVLRVVHELLWITTGAAELLGASHPLRAELDAHVATLDAAAARPHGELDAAALWQATEALRRRVAVALGGRAAVRLRVSL